MLSSHETGPCWQPAVDVYRRDSGWLCKFDLAGVGPDEFEVRCGQRTLVLSGVRRDRQVAGEAGDMRPWSLEIAYCRFERTVELPCALDRAELTCELRDGMLLVAITPEVAP